jgi:hypothetical protein
LVNKVAVAGVQVAHAAACPVRCRPDGGDATHAVVDPCQRDRDVAAHRETASDHTAVRHVAMGGDPVEDPHRVQGELADHRPHVTPERADESISQVRGRFRRAFAVLPWIDTDSEETGAGKSFEHGEHGVFRASKEGKPQGGAAGNVVGALIAGDPSDLGCHRRLRIRTGSRTESCVGCLLVGGWDEFGLVEQTEPGAIGLPASPRIRRSAAQQRSSTSR